MTDAAQSHDAFDMTTTEIEDELGDLGFDAQFGARPNAMVLCFTCRNEFPASIIDADAASRTEGESDPDDMSLIVNVTCPNCRADGTLTLQYGPAAGPNESAVVAALDRAEPAIPLGVEPPEI